MGYYKHHAILVYSHHEDLALKAYRKALEYLESLAPVSHMTKNSFGDSCFMVAPDGSKEGWDHSEQGDRAREKYLDWLKEQHYEDGSTSLKYVEVSFAEEEYRPSTVTTDSNYESLIRRQQ